MVNCRSCGVCPSAAAADEEQQRAFRLGTDGIRDLWSPYGDGDMLRVAQQFARLHGFKRDEELSDAVDMITKGATWFVGNDRNDFTIGSRADIVLVDALHPMDALVRAPRRELVVAGGQVSSCVRANW